MAQSLVSAVMPVHEGVLPEHLDQACESLLAQTCLPDEIVVVHDGPLRDAHLAVLDNLTESHPAVVTVALASNAGPGVANQAGLEAASAAWIAKVDADDICLPHRVERQLEAVAGGRVEVCGSAMLEFAQDGEKPSALRRAPKTQEAIGKRLRYNSPVNHPTAFYLRSAAIDAGGYPPWRSMEDYALFARMYARGARMVNLDEPLVLFRATPDVTARRRSTTARSLEIVLQRELRDLGLVGTPQMLWNVAWRTGFRMLPPPAVRMVSRRVLAGRADASSSRAHSL